MGKFLVEEGGAMVVECWSQNHSDAYAVMTEKERDAVTEAAEKQLERCRKLLGFWELREKVFARPNHSEKIHEKLWPS
jgi:hypothetical protein